MRSLMNSKRASRSWTLYSSVAMCLKKNLIEPRRASTSTTSSKVATGIYKTRNVGIMAHIDAGKTTTTERMLYYSGRISSPGEVHHGDTVTDFLPQERERGITIQSAVVGFDWRDSHVNLIDTPGHVDFTFEVERSLRVVDSAVAVLDASAGVEAQTLTVWRQASDYELPRIIFLNKMDKTSASHSMCLDSISKKLKSLPILLQSPVYQSGNKGSGLIGLVDLITLKRMIFKQRSKGVEFSVDDVSTDKDFVRQHCELVECVADLDSDLATLVIETESIEKIPEVEIQRAIKRMMMSNSGIPVLLGSSYRNIGVQPLMDAMITYLPNPVEVKSKDPVISSYGSELCAFAFKTIHDRQLGPLTFVRVFGGTLSPGHKIYNVTRNKNERVLKAYLPFADELKEVSHLNQGEVGVVSGLKETVTGDSLTSSSTVAVAALKKLRKVLGREGEDEGLNPCLSGVNIPEPVFFCSVEPASLTHQKGLEAALECLQREDPSLHVHVDPDTSQTVLSGMGELHLEIIHGRLKSEFKVEADLGKLMVAYKETIPAPVVNRITFERKLADQKHSVTIELEVRPKKRGSGPHLPLVRKGLGKEVQENLKDLSEKQLRCILNGVEGSLRSGPKLSFPVVEVEVLVNFFEVGRGTSATIIEAASASCIRQALQNSTSLLLEPIVSLEVVVDENFHHIVIDDLNRRRFSMEGVDMKHGNKLIYGTAPLSELIGYSTSLRTVSSGLGTFTMQFSHYQRVISSIEEEKIVTKVRGF